MSNLSAIDRSERLKDEIRAILEQHPPLATPLTAKRILRLLKYRPLPAERTVRWHMANIRAEADEWLHIMQTAGSRIG